MSLLVPPRRFDPELPEQMDRPGNAPDLLRADLAVLESINRWLGGHRLATHFLDRWRRAGRWPQQRPVKILDLATGAADVPRTIVRWARGHGLPLAITAVDTNPAILEIARERSAGYPEIEFAQHSLLQLPYPADSFDFVLCALTLHHFAESDVVEILRRIHDIGRCGYLVNDLRRQRLAIWMSKLMARTIITNPIARFDAPASCERAFTMAELSVLARRAGLVRFSIRPHWACRFALAGAKP